MPKDDIKVVIDPVTGKAMSEELYKDLVDVRTKKEEGTLEEPEPTTKEKLVKILRQVMMSIERLPSDIAVSIKEERPVGVLAPKPSPTPTQLQFNVQKQVDSMNADELKGLSDYLNKKLYPEHYTED